MLRAYFDRDRVHQGSQYSNLWTWVFVSFAAVGVLILALAVIVVRLSLRQ
jgi:hypothetical protein